ncbi:unnamed protein product [Chironomus riparius]|uniref:Uncharacterized protein n=1 Tax=Chironomus riparius TaxID=315576 RepID=A0A9N9RGX1_9DIPT|nr:unnamed protein product [Chironomus riparius]
MKTIDRFLCFKVITGAFIVGVFNMIVALLLFFHSLNALKSGVYKENKTLIEIADSSLGEVMLYTSPRSEIDRCLYILDMLAQVIIIAVNVTFILGVVTRDIKMIIPGVVVSAFGIAAHPLNILMIDTTFFGFIKASLLGVVLFLCFVTSYSAYVKIKNEQSTSCTVQQCSNNEPANP